MAFETFLMSCPVAVNLLIFGPGAETDFGVDWTAVCAGDVPALANETVWVELFNAAIDAANPPPPPVNPVFIKAHQILLDYVLFAVCLFGLLANLLTFVTLVREEKKTGTMTFLLALSVVDWLFLAGKIIIPGLFISGRTEPIEGVNVTVLVLVHTTEVIEVWLIIAITAERFIMVCWPLKGRTICTVRNARWAIGIVLVGSVLYRIPHYIFGVAKRARAPEYYSKVYEIGFDGFVLYLIPLGLLFVMNIKLLHTVLAAKRRRQQMSLVEPTGSGVSVSMTMNIVAVVMLFLVCQSLRFSFFLYVVDSIYWKAIFPFSAHDPMRYIVQPVAEIMLAINSAANFFIYVLFYPKFRDGFRRTFLPCLSRHPGQNTYSLTRFSNTGLGKTLSTRNTTSV